MGRPRSTGGVTTVFSLITSSPLSFYPQLFSHTALQPFPPLSHSRSSAVPAPPPFPPPAVRGRCRARSARAPPPPRVWRGAAPEARSERPPVPALWRRREREAGAAERAPPWSTSAPPRYCRRRRRCGTARAAGEPRLLRGREGPPSPARPLRARALLFSLPPSLPCSLPRSLSRSLLLFRGWCLPARGSGAARAAGRGTGLGARCSSVPPCP